MIRIYGASDDLVEIEGHPSGDEVGCYDEDVIVIVGNERIGGVAVRMSYAPQLGKGVGFACWTAEIGQLDEGVAIPWPVTLTNTGNASDPGYSVCVDIAAPGDVPLAWSKVKHGRKS